MIIHVEHLSKRYKSKITTNIIRDLFMPTYRLVDAVNDISFSIAKGESVALLGPNGAGKTTTMKMLSGLIYPSSGAIHVLGFIPFERKRAFLMKIGLVMGNKTGLDWDLTPLQSFQLIKKIYGITDISYKKRLHDLTEMLDASNFLDIQVRKLSLGERMKMELIGAILHEPEVLFLDEPTIGLDIISKQKIRDFLRDIQKEFGVTLLLTSHDMDDVEKVCDRVMVFTHGMKVYDDALTKLLHQHTRDRYVKFIFADFPEIELLRQYGSIIESTDKSATLKTDSTKLASVIESILKKFEIKDIDILSLPLEEIIADIYHKGTK